MIRLSLTFFTMVLLAGCAQIASLTGSFPDEAATPPLIPLGDINAAAAAPSAAQTAGEALADQAANLRAKADRL